MKHEPKKTRKKGSGQTANKGIKATAKKSAKTDSKGKTKKPISKGSKSIPQNSSRKRPSVSKSNLRGAERENLELLEKLFAADEKKIRKNSSRKSGKKRHDKSESKSARRVRVSVKKKRGDNVYKITFNTTSLQKIILKINEYPFKELYKAVRGKQMFPRQIIVILKVKVKFRPDPIYFTLKSPLDYDLSNVEQVKRFVATTVADFMNGMHEMLIEKYDIPPSGNKILEIAIRFIYPLEMKKR